MNRYLVSDIRRARKAIGWSQAELGARSGSTRETVNQIENLKGFTGRVSAGHIVNVLEEEGHTIEMLHGVRRCGVALENPFYSSASSARGSSTKAQPRDKRGKPICGAKNRKGNPCHSKQLLKNGRCKFHGGMSTGPRSPEGKERIRQAQKKRWQKWHAEKLAPSAV